MRNNHPFLKSVYLVSEADDEWVDEIRMWLVSDGWSKVWIGHRNVWNQPDEAELGIAVDMEIARRSGVFVGNGFSTTTSNVVLLRMRDQLHPDFTQFF